MGPTRATSRSGARSGLGLGLSSVPLGYTPAEPMKYGTKQWAEASFSMKNQYIQTIARSIDLLSR